MLSVQVYAHPNDEATIDWIRSEFGDSNSVSFFFEQSRRGLSEILCEVRSSGLPTDLVVVHLQGETSFGVIEEHLFIPTIAFSRDVGYRQPKWLVPGVVLLLSHDSMREHLKQIIESMQGPSSRISTSSASVLDSFKGAIESILPGDLPTWQMEATPFEENLASPTASRPHISMSKGLPVNQSEDRHLLINRTGAIVFFKLLVADGWICDATGLFEKELNKAANTEYENLASLGIPLFRDVISAKAALWPESRVLYVDDQHSRGWSTLLALLFHGSTDYLQNANANFPDCLFKNTDRPLFLAVSDIGRMLHDPYESISQIFPQGRFILPIDIAILDYRLLLEEENEALNPKMISGVKLAEALKKADPSLPILAFTASSRDSTVKNLAPRDPRLHYRKPGPLSKPDEDFDGFRELVNTIDRIRSGSWSRCIYLSTMIPKMTRLRISSSLHDHNKSRLRKSDLKNIESDYAKALESLWEATASSIAHNPQREDALMKWIDLVTDFTGESFYMVKKGSFLWKHGSDYVKELFELLKSLRNTLSHDFKRIVADVNFLILATLCRLDLTFESESSSDFSILLPFDQDHIPHESKEDLLDRIKQRLLSGAIEEQLLLCFDTNPHRLRREPIWNLFMDRFSCRVNETYKDPESANALISSLSTIQGASYESTKKQAELRKWIQNNVPTTLIPDLCCSMSEIVDDDPRYRTLAGLSVVGRLLKLASLSEMAANDRYLQHLISKISFQCTSIVLDRSLPSV